VPSRRSVNAVLLAVVGLLISFARARLWAEDLQPRLLTLQFVSVTPVNIAGDECQLVAFLLASQS